MGSNPQELNLDFKLPASSVPKTITGFLRELSMIGDVSERLSKLDEYVKQLEEEMRKIDVFKRELPLCMVLLKDAITALKEGAASDVRPVMEEFIPLKKNSEENGGVKMEKDSRDKKTWMSSVQLWSYDGKQKSMIGLKERSTEYDCYAAEKPFHRNGGGAFLPFKGFSGIPAMAARKEEKEIFAMNGPSLLIPGNSTPKPELGSDCLSSKSPSSTTNIRSSLQSSQQQQSSRKQRRCWSPELHRRFVSALQQLGGSQVATPKQIRELMQVDGLTNDEVKSHLQKYRLHTRRVPTSTSPTASSSPANQPVVVFRGSWMPQDQYGDSSKPSPSQSGSPQGPLQLAGAAGGISITAGDSMEDEEDRKSESYSWKGRLHKPSEDGV